MKKTLIYSILPLLFACSQAAESTKSTGLFPVKEYGKWGFINVDGRIVIKCQFDQVKKFSGGLAAILVDSLWGFIDTTGGIVIKPQFCWVKNFSDGLCKVAIRKDTAIQHAFIHPNGSIAFITAYEDADIFKYGRAVVTVNEEVCVIDKSGKIIFNTHYPYGSRQFQEGILKVWTGESTKYFDTNGKIIAAFPEMGGDDFSEGLAFVRSGDKSFYIDKTGKPKINLKNTELIYRGFSDGLALVGYGGYERNAGFIDTTGNIVIPISYNDIRNFRDGLAVFRHSIYVGFIDKRGKLVIKPQFEDVEYNGFLNGLCRAKQNHQWGYINHKGQFVWKEQVGLEYAKIDLSKWKLDTLKIGKPLYAEKYVGGDNYPRKQSFPALNQFTLQIDTTDLTVFADKYFGLKLYMINASKDTIDIPAQAGRIEIIQQAKNNCGDWQDIEIFINDFCGNSYHTVQIAPNEFQIFATPIFKGEFKTQLRFKLILDNQEIYSNVYTGHINYGQLLSPDDRHKKGLNVSARLFSE